MSNDTYGFRYLNIKVINGSLTLNNIRFISRLYPNIVIAEFECNDDFLNKTWQQSSYTATVLSEDGYVDSAEGAEWIGDVGMIQYPVIRMVKSEPGEDRNKILYSDPRLIRTKLLHTVQSQQNQIILNNRSVHFTTDGGFLEFKVKSGVYIGVVNKM